MAPFKSKMPEAYARITWCEETFGPGVQNGIIRWWRHKGFICFKDEKDYVMYLLRWA